MRPLPREFYERSTVKVARELIGKTLVRKVNGKVLSGVITETEAYTHNDPASHAFWGCTRRNSAMFGTRGCAYIYFIYGNHWCLNAVANGGKAGAVLIRSAGDATGPGRLTKAFCIDRRHNCIDMTKRGELFISDTPFSGKIKSTPRIGITKAAEKKWRFVIS